MIHNKTKNIDKYSSNLWKNQRHQQYKIITKIVRIFGNFIIIYQPKCKNNHKLVNNILWKLLIDQSIHINVKIN